MKTEITIRKMIRRLLTVFLIALSSFALLTAEELYPCARAFAG
jgi:hypothetical protein